MATLPSEPVTVAELLEHWRAESAATEHRAARDLLDAHIKGIGEGRRLCADELEATLRVHGCPHCQKVRGLIMATPSDVGPVHLVDEGRYRAVVKDGVPMIERVDTAGAVRSVEG